MTIWQDEIKHENGKVIFAARGKGQAEKRLGALERILNLKWAQEHCDGRLRVVMVVAKDIKAIPREAIDWFPDEKLILKITELNETTGAFRAEQVD